MSGRGPFSDAEARYHLAVLVMRLRKLADESGSEAVYQAPVGELLAVLGPLAPPMGNPAFQAFQERNDLRRCGIVPQPSTSDLTDPKEQP